MKIAITIDKYAGGSYKVECAAVSYTRQLSEAMLQVDPKRAQPGVVIVPPSEAPAFLDTFLPGRGQQDLSSGMRVSRHVDLEQFLQHCGPGVRDAFHNPKPTPVEES